MKNCLTFRGSPIIIGKVPSALRDLSSAGRASVLQTEGHRFEPYRSHEKTVRTRFCPGNAGYFFGIQSEFRYGGIAQLARAHGSYPWCRGFKSPSRYALVPVRGRKGIDIAGCVLYNTPCSGALRTGVWLSLARVPDLGSGGRRFKSCHPDFQTKE